MTTVVILLGLLALAGAFPQDELWRNIYRRVFDARSPDQLSDDDNCVQLAEATYSFLRYSCITHNHLKVRLDTQTLIELGEKLFGFDIFNDKPALEQFACNIAEATSVADLKTILATQNNFNFRLFRLAYDYYTVMYLLFGITGERGQHSYQVLKSIGLLALDPEGTRYMAELAAGENSAPIEEEKYLSDTVTGNIQEKCVALQDVFWNTGTLRDPIIRKLVLSWIGVDLYDRQQVGKLLCDIVKAAEGGLEDVYKVLDDKGFIVRLYRALYPNIVKSAKRMKEDLESIIPLLEKSISEMKANDREQGLRKESLTASRFALNFFLQLERTSLLYLE